MVTYDFDDEESNQNPYYLEYPSLEFSWLYIAVDIRDMCMAKIGLTRRENPQQRISQGKTYNPFLVLFTTYELSKCTYGTSQQELNDIEGYIHRRSDLGMPIKHLYTERDSEWFYISPEDAEHQIDWILAKRGFSVDNKTLWSTCVTNEKFNGIAVDRMKKIKTIFRPYADEFVRVAESSRIPFELYQSYYDYLVQFHLRDNDGKVYL